MADELYALADYSGSGLLLDLCRQSLEAENNNKKSNNKNNKAKKAPEGAKGEESGVALDWRELLADGAPPNAYRAQLLTLLESLSRAIRPFLAGEHLFTPTQTQTEVGGAPSGAPLTPGAQRKLSWRRHLVAREAARRWARRCSLSTRPEDGSNGGEPQLDEKGNKQRHTIGLPLLQRLIHAHPFLCDLPASCPEAPSWPRAKRGHYGESLVHVLLVNHSNEHLILLVCVLHLWPSLALDVFESCKFFGLGCLHLTLAQSNEPLLAWLTHLPGAARLLEQRVTGSLFRVPPRLSGEDHAAEHSSGKSARAAGAAPPGGKSSTRRVGQSPPASPWFWCDRQPHWPTANGHAHLFLFDRLAGLSAASDRAHGAAYLGELPLSWSVSLHLYWAYQRLLECGAARNGHQDAQKNTCLHLLVMNNQAGWTRFLVKSGSDQSLRNASGLTPLLLACHLGRVQLFEEFLELSAVEFWSYSMISCRGYPLKSIDSLLASASEQSAVSVILESSVSDNEQKSALLSSAVVKRLLEEKWRNYARRLFYRDFISLLLHLTLFTLAISLRPPNGTMEQVDEEGVAASQGQRRSNTSDWVRHSSELLSCLMSGHQVFRFGREWRQPGNRWRLQWIYNPLLPSSLAANTLILASAPVRLLAALARGPALRVAARQAEDVLLIFAAPLLWSSLLFFIAAYRVTGPFVAMIGYMVVRDLRQFSLIYLVFLCSFAQSIYFVNFANIQLTEAQTQDDTESGVLWRLLASYLELWMELFKMTLGVYDLQPYRHSALARLFFLLFIYLIPILFNMLIAMMNNTYSQIIAQSERAWNFQWARCLFALERRLGPAERAAYLRRYSINMPAPAGASAPSVSANANAEAPAAASGGAQTQTRTEPQSQPQNEPQPAPEAEAAAKTAAAPAVTLVPALMIIKRMHFTQAERRRIVRAHWQKSIRGALELVKRRQRHLLS